HICAVPPRPTPYSIDRLEGNPRRVPDLPRRTSLGGAELRPRAARRPFLNETIAAIDSFPMAADPSLDDRDPRRGGRKPSSNARRSAGGDDDDGRARRGSGRVD